MRICIVEDKRPFAAHLGQALQAEGHDVELAFDGETGLHLCRTGNFDLLILDVMLPKRDGLGVIRKLREARLKTHTILVSARDSMQDIINGLDAGADDYLTKPFALDVLFAKVRASERRLSLRPPSNLQLGEVTLVPHQLELQRSGRTESLTRTECALLEVLMRRANSVVPHAVLLAEGWAGNEDASFDSLYVFIRALRQKLSRPGEVELLHTIRGVGYCLRTPLC